MWPGIGENGEVVGVISIILLPALIYILFGFGLPPRFTWRRVFLAAILSMLAVFFSFICCANVLGT